MRIENLNLNPLNTPNRHGGIKPIFHLPVESIESMQSSSFLVTNVKRIYRKIFNPIKWFLSFFLPVKPYVSIDFEKIDYLRLEDQHRVGTIHYRVTLDGASTENQVSYRKSGSSIMLLNVNFTDKEMREHIASILGQILVREQATCFSTNLLSLSKLLWNCGFSSPGTKIRVYPRSNHMNDRLMNDLINLAKQRKEEGRLPEKYNTHIDRIQYEIDHYSIADGFHDLMASVKIANPRTLSADVLLSDILEIMDALDIEQARGLSFNIVGNGWPKFSKH